MSEANYSSICGELDTLALKILELMQKLLDERDHFDDACKSGFADIAKTRYVMGSNSVSLLQIDESHIMPLYKIESEKCTRDKINFQNYKVLNEEKERKSTTVRQRFPKTLDNDDIQNSSNNKSKDNTRAEYASSSDPNDNKNDSDQEVSQIIDPLRWFGVLVPQSLRSAQSNFQQSILISAYIASLQSELNSSLHQYEKLKLQKKTLRATE